jgi:outer membrane lipoprotein LolB
MQGQVAIKANRGGGQASIRWQQLGGLSRLRLAGPFGAGQVELAIAPNLVTLTDASGERSLAYTGSDAAERFMAEHLGWSFPVHSARYWVLGLLDPASSGERRFDETGTLRSLTQYGWTVVFDRFARFDEQYLPAKLVIESPALRLRLVVRGWTRDSV